jgi:cytochrome P450
MEPANPLAAVSHVDPYPYYERLLAGPPLHYDGGLNLWIASRAATVCEVFASRACCVRPATEPVPTALLGLPAGEIFAHLVRMNDGAGHDRPKLALEGALAALASAEVGIRTRHIARLTAPSTATPEALSNFIRDVPVMVVGELLGFADGEHRKVADWTREFVACLSPLSTSEQLAAASSAAARLRFRMQSLLRSAPAESGSLLAQVRARAETVGWGDSGAIVANLVGLLSQTYEGTAGLIGNAVVALATHPRLIDQVLAREDGWDQLVHETSRYDSPVQNTRRYIVAPARIGGVDLLPGSIVLVVLAAANRDPGVNACPGEFRLDRPDRCVFSFSRGAHACPGQALARGIARAALCAMFETLHTDWLERIAWSWGPSLNVRLPVFRVR